MKEKKALAFVVSSPTTFLWLESLITNLCLEYKVILIADFNSFDIKLSKIPNSVEKINIPIQRDISLIKDLKALFMLIKYFFKNDFLIVHSITPKAGLISAISSYLTRVPIRIHTFTGQVWFTETGIKREVLKVCDKLISKLSTFILVDSLSQKKFLLKERVISIHKSSVIGKGSISGVDLTRFSFDKEARRTLRDKLNPDNRKIILFLGRLKRDKGILDLIEGYNILREEGLKIGLWIVGPDEENLTEFITNKDDITIIPYTSEPELYMTSADVFCLPSYREGFGNVVIESAACGIPSVVNRIYGLTDAVIENKTGLFTKPKSIDSLVKVLRNIMEDDSFRKELGRNAQERVSKDFSQEAHNQLQLELYEQLTERTKKG